MHARARNYIEAMTFWAPGTDWEVLDGAEGPATEGVWRARLGDQAWIVKRICPIEDGNDDKRSFQWWRREVEVAASGISAMFRGLVAPQYKVQEDDHGATLWSREIHSSPIPPYVVAHALGELATVEVDDPGWFVVGRLRARVALADSAESATLSVRNIDGKTRSLIESFWSRRDDALSLLDEMPHVLSHGDALPRNLLRHDGVDVTAIDWDQLGHSPVGSDLATFSMWVGEPIERLMDAYLEGAAELKIDPRLLKESVALTTALIAVSRLIRTASTNRFTGYRDRLVKATPQLSLALKLVE